MRHLPACRRASLARKPPNRGPLRYTPSRERPGATPLGRAALSRSHVAGVAARRSLAPNGPGKLGGMVRFAGDNLRVTRATIGVACLSEAGKCSNASPPQPAQPGGSGNS